MISAILIVATGAGAVAPDTVPLFDNLGSYHRPVTTSVPLAQRYFDQGIRLFYGFNHPEAVRAFEEAARRDPSCAMCHWGVAIALGPNINAPMDSAAVRPAHDAIRRALAVARSAAPEERALIAALARRYSSDGTGRASLDSAYAAAALDVARRFPRDDDAQVLAADALMNLRPWMYWKADGSPEAGTREMVDMLERVVTRSPEHPGACHFYIHAVEAVRPDKAVACAERLAALMPGAGHLVHMPAHIYIRVGRYQDAVEANHHAVHADETYISRERPAGAYAGTYYPHNHHFLAFAAMLAGQSGVAIDAAEAVVRHVPVEIAAAVPSMEPMLAFHHAILQTFGRWDELLALPLPPERLQLATALAHFARGMALSAKGRPQEAEAALASIRKAIPRIAEGDPRTTAEIGAQVLSAELAARAGRDAAALVELRTAARREDGMVYTEPPLWHQPVRHFLGAQLLRMNRWADAEEVYREDLRRFPENGWSLVGLAASLRGQGNAAEADRTLARLKRSWTGADVELAASRF